MEIVLDSCCLIDATKCENNPITVEIESGRIKIMLDESGGIVGEWGSLCGHDNVKQLIIYWASKKGVGFVKNIEALPPILRRKLREFGCRGGIDYLVIKVSLKTVDRTIISRDPDFWNPKNKRMIGDPKAVVADYLLKYFNIEVMVLEKLLAELAS